MGHAGGAAWPGEAEGHWRVQLYSGSHERTNAELQSPPCSSTGTVQEFEWRTGKDISSCLKSHGFFCVLQVEFHPRLCQAELKSVCEEYGVCFQAYSSLGQGDLVTDPVVLEVAKQCQRTPAQVSPLALLSWVYLCFYCKHFKVLLSLSSGAAAVGGAAGCRCAPKVIKRRPNTGERQTF